ncbi:hypothetical protein [Burkholderia vietnamiensis]|uniref:hypothetical protein n=1 Tax=Burkholderia vietnamiensis TaxID=60552 RepID=UPI001594BC69|nr:hypothetical protein [Burkholderia vietnamiensis]
MDGTFQVAQRIVNAENHFIELVQEITGCSREEGAKALTTMSKLKVIKLDVGVSRYRPIHGVYMDADVLRNAINY